jgi:isoquinoline 1-oxidoreductase beta subunit
MRAVGLATHGFVTQCFTDELARAAGKDPYDFQRALLNPDKVSAIASNPDEISPRSRVARLRAVLDEAARKSSWNERLAPNRGRGIAAIEGSDAFFSAVVEVMLDGKGWFNVDRVVVAGDPSFLVNPDGAEAQVEGSVVFGLSSALYGEITIDKGQQSKATSTTIGYSASAKCRGSRPIGCSAGSRRGAASANWSSPQWCLP